MNNDKETSQKTIVIPDIPPVIIDYEVRDQGRGQK